LTVPILSEAAWAQTRLPRRDPFLQEEDGSAVTDRVLVLQVGEGKAGRPDRQEKKRAALAAGGLNDILAPIL